MLLTNFLQGKEGLATDTEKFLIVETNFKVYAYTDNKVHEDILSLFMRKECRFPNLICGILSRESLKDAFKRKITAKQIMNYLKAHSK